MQQSFYSFTNVHKREKKNSLICCSMTKQIKSFKFHKTKHVIFLPGHQIKFSTRIKAHSLLYLTLHHFNDLKCTPHFWCYFTQKRS